MRRIPFNRGWETRPHANFFLEMVGAAAPWQPVTLPHDAALGRDRDASHGAGAGYVPGGVVRVPDDARRARGVPRQARAAGVRGRLPHRDGLRERRPRRPLGDGVHGLHRRPRRPPAVTAQDNEIRVVCRAHEDSRWYSGAGIHRPVHLVVGALTHIALDGVRVTTKDVDDEFAVVEVATTVEHDGRGLATLDLVTELRTPPAPSSRPRPRR